MCAHACILCPTPLPHKDFNCASVTDLVKNREVNNIRMSNCETQLVHSAEQIKKEVSRNVER